MALTTILTKADFDAAFTTAIPNIPEENKKRYVVPIPVENRGHITRYVTKNINDVAAICIVNGDKEEVLVLASQEETLPDARELLT